MGPSMALSERPFAPRRRAVLRRAAAKAKVAGLLITSPEDVGYLSGFTGDDSFLLIFDPAMGGSIPAAAQTKAGDWVVPPAGGRTGNVPAERQARGRRKERTRSTRKATAPEALLDTTVLDATVLDTAVLVTDGRYSEQAQGDCPGIGIFVRKGGMIQAVAEVLKGRRRGRIGFQADHVTFRMFELLAKAIGRERLEAIADLVAEHRMVKDEGEIRLIRKAVRIAQEAFRSLLAGGAKALIVRTEREVAAELDYRMRLAGASGPGFATSVCAGPNSSRPHHRPGSARIVRDQPVLIDWGAEVEGYRSDLTRVVFPGRILPKLAELYEVVLAAQAAGVKALRAGAALKSADAAARSVIERAGYGQQFVHGLGHGVGRAIHELPFMSRTAKGRLKAGMVVTVEPGVYLPGVGGIRIEDDVEVGPRGGRKLSSLPNALADMVLR